MFCVPCDMWKTSIFARSSTVIGELSLQRQLWFSISNMGWHCRSVSYRMDSSYKETLRVTRWTSTLFRCKVAIILRMFHVLYFMTVFWWLRWCITLLLMYTSYGLNAVCFGSLSWKIVPIFLKRRKGGMWQIGPNLSSGIRWCLALASVRPQWCLLWRFFMCVHVCVRVWMVARILYVWWKLA